MLCAPRSRTRCVNRDKQINAIKPAREQFYCAERLRFCLFLRTNILLFTMWTSFRCTAPSRARRAMDRALAQNCWRIFFHEQMLNAGGDWIYYYVAVSQVYVRKHKILLVVHCTHSPTHTRTRTSKKPFSCVACIMHNIANDNLFFIFLILCFSWYNFIVLCKQCNQHTISIML